MPDIRAISYGSTAAIVTNMALMIGLNAATATRAAIVSGLLIVAIADNLTDSLSIHIYQESEQLDPHRAFLTTLANYASRLLLSCTFLLLVLLLPIEAAIAVSIVWGLSLLAVLTYALARMRKVRAVPELVKHLSVALVVIIASRVIGAWISLHVR